MSFVDYLECARCGETFSPGRLYGLCPECDSPLLVRYRLREIKRNIKKTILSDRPADMWRYLEVMPVDGDADIVSLGEGFTPLLSLERLGRSLGMSHLFLKDESRNPTGSFKARGLSAAVSMARKLGVDKLAMPSAGNAAGALAAYGAKAGAEVHLFMPVDTPEANIAESQLSGAHVELVPGHMGDAARVMAEQSRQKGWFDVSTLREPYRIEGKKTMGYELVEQLQWKVPDVILYPTGGGTGLIGLWKAFAEAEELGWISSRRPRLVAVQSTGCAPIVKAFEQGKDSAEPWPNPTTFASGIRVARAIGDFIILEALRESEGRAIAMEDAEIYKAIFELASAEGVFACPEGAACWAALKQLRAEGWIKDEETVVLLNTGSGLKYVDSIRKFANRE